MAPAVEDGLVGQPTAIDDRSMVILYGSETGSSEEIAGELGKMAEQLHFQTTVDEMDSFKLGDLLRATLVIFVTSTTGQGDMPKNTTKFWRNLRREKLNNTNCLGVVRFAIFGLGDSSYPKFNWAARKLRVRLLQLGASEFFQAGEADERHDNGIDSIYLPWYKDLRAAILATHPLPDSIMPIPDDVQLPPKYGISLLPTITIPDSAEDAKKLEEQEQKFLATKDESAVLTHVDHPRPISEQRREDFGRLARDTFPITLARKDETWEEQSGIRVDVLDKDNIIKDHPEKYLLTRQADAAGPVPADRLPIPNTVFARLGLNKRVTPKGHWQDVRRLFLDVRCPKQAFPESAAGATVIIYPKNYPEDVQALIDLMDWQSIADTPIDLNQRSQSFAEHIHIPSSRPKKLFVKEGLVSLRDLLTHNLDITSVPKRNFIRELAFFTNEDIEKERLKELTAAGNEQEFYDYTSRPRRTIIELLRDFPGVKIPYKWVLDLFPIIRGREFSVCNGGEQLSGEPGFTYSIEILVALVEYKTIIRKPRQGLCSRYLKHLPVGTELNIGFKHPTSHILDPVHGGHRRPVIAVATGTGIAPIRALIEDRNVYHQPGDVLLFFGCRNKHADYFYREEWEAAPHVQVIPAFSRDPIKPEDEKALNPHRDPSLRLSKSLGGGGVPVPGPDNTELFVFDYDAGKNYVQNQIRKHASLVGEFMRKRPIVCVCGNAGRMPISVRNALRDALIMSGIVDSAEDGEKWLQDQANLTYWQETW